MKEQTKDRETSYGEKGLSVIDRLGVYLSKRQIFRFIKEQKKLTALDIGCGYEASILNTLLPCLQEGTGIDIKVSDRVKSSEKLSFIELGSFFSKKNISKQVFLIGKLINTKNENSDLDEIYNLNEGVIQKNTPNKNFAVSAYYSFVCMFTIVVE